MKTFEQYEGTSEHEQDCFNKSNQIRAEQDDRDCIYDLVTKSSDADETKCMDLVQSIANDYDRDTQALNALDMLVRMANQHSLEVQHQVRVDYIERELMDDAS